MIEDLGYDKNMFVIERGIDQLPHLHKKISGNRRVDILYYAKGIHSDWDLYPLLLIECKAGQITKGAKEQIIGYNYHIQSYFLAIVNAVEIKMFREGFEVPFIPHCDELIKVVKKGMCENAR